MSFGTYERKVRDPSLASGRRVNALAGCVERYSPLGFHVTFGYLEHVAGPFRRDEAALLRAIDSLSTSRTTFQTRLQAYDEQRAAAKRLGRRQPSAGEPGPRYCVWYGDARNAALFALGGLLLRPADPSRRGRVRQTDPAVLRLVAECVERGGRLDPAHLAEAQLLERRFQKIRRAVKWPHVPAGWTTANDSLWALHLIEDALVDGLQTDHPTDDQQ